jgi:hypothetical protein
MRHHGATEEGIAAALLTENATRCCPPLAEPEVQRIAASVSRYPPEPLSGVTLKFTPSSNGQPAEPEGLPAYRPFPVDALPPRVREFSTEGAAALACDVVYLALPTLTVTASAIGNARTIRLKRDWEEASVVWTAIVAESGTVKTPGWKASTAALFRVQRQLLQKYREQLGEYEKRRAKARAEKADFDEPAPVYRRVVCGDITIEKLSAVLEDNPRGLLVTRDELSAWLGGFTRYKTNSSDLPAWLEMHRAGTVVVDRKSGEKQHYFVPRAAVSVCGGIQPGTLIRAMSAEFLEAGLAARILMAMPPRTLKRWTEAEISNETETAYHGLLDKLLALDLSTNADGWPVPAALPLTTSAKEVWLDFYREWATEQLSADEELAAAFAKLEGYAARFALVHSVVTQVVSGTNARQAVDRPSVEAGIALARWFADEARRIYAALSESEEERTTRRLLDFIRAHDGRVTARMVQRSNQRRYPTAEHAELALTALTPLWGSWAEQPSSTKGGQPTRLFVLRPAVPEAPGAAGGP